MIGSDNRDKSGKGRCLPMFDSWLHGRNY